MCRIDKCDTDVKTVVFSASGSRTCKGLPLSQPGESAVFLCPFGAASNLINRSRPSGCSNAPIDKLAQQVLVFAEFIRRYEEGGSYRCAKHTASLPGNDTCPLFEPGQSTGPGRTIRGALLIFGGMASQSLPWKTGSSIARTSGSPR